ncbi:receptor-interacting serine/threonine-protein kinase 3 [Synchiropus splendidus]|uniref:receptor-interacting serine/threonine-protein kinase 3 n=1 Tax=Synchiropus splendidus TaxID=270530 RepID=UPI00237D42EC|nr:receptor-interacting serine/threonine-protein kinase 3 [Synchiropus splendidus]
MAHGKQYNVFPASALSVQSFIGNGGFGEVFKGSLLVDVAVKYLYNDSGSDLLKEIKIMQKCRSPYVVDVLGVCPGDQPNKLKLVMEYMERGSLANLLKVIDEPPPWALVVKVATQVSQGIKFLHSLSPPVLHLDLKPANVLLDKHLNVKLTDFGLSRVRHSQSYLMQHGEISDCVIGGTIHYMPPEAFRKPWTPSEATDIYSFGILLWALVTRETPYPDVLDTVFSIRIPAGDRPSLDDIDALEDGRPGLDKLKELMQMCWHQEIPERPTASDCAERTQELYEENYNQDAITSLLEKLDIKDRESKNPEEQPGSNSNNRHDMKDKRSTNPEEQPESNSNKQQWHRSLSEPVATYRLEHVVGLQIGDYNKMDFNNH